MACESVRILLDAGATAQAIANGWIVVTGMAAWEGDQLVARHAGALVENGGLQ